MLVYMQVEMYGFFFPLVPQPITLTWHVLLLTIVSWLLDCHRGRTGIWLPFQACTWRGSPLRLWGFQLSRPLVLSCFFFMNHLIEVFYVSHCLGVLNITPFTVGNSWFFSRLQTGQIIRAHPHRRTGQSSAMLKCRHLHTKVCCLARGPGYSSHVQICFSSAVDLRGCWVSSLTRLTTTDLYHTSIQVPAVWEYSEKRLLKILFFSSWKGESTVRLLSLFPFWVLVDRKHVRGIHGMSMQCDHKASNDVQGSGN